jgi:Bacterial PH domain
MIHPTKKDPWVMALMYFGLVVPTLLLASMFFKGGVPIQALPVLLGVVVFYVLLLLAVATPIEYDLSPTVLHIRAGWLLRISIPVADILSVHPTNNPLSSPALSLDRLDIRYRKAGGEKSVMISPLNKEDFVRELASYDSGFTRTGASAMRMGRS